MSYSELKTSRGVFRLLHRLEGKGVFERDIPEKFDGVLVEMVHNPAVADSDKRAEIFVEGLEGNPDLKVLKERVKENKARIWFGDLAESKSLSSLRDVDLMLGEVLAGLLFLGRGFSFWRKKEKKRGLRALGWTIGALWLLSSVVEIAGGFLVKVAGNTVRRGPLKAVGEAIAWASVLHPEKTVVFLRNLVMAQKTWEVAGLEKGEKPLVLLDFHFGHVGLLKMLKWKPETRLALLRAYKPFAKDIFENKTQKDYLARLISVYWDEGKWVVERNFLVESLREI